eukprot:scaffold120243_cov21-Tisochrysis_lutea.AAC.1
MQVDEEVTYASKLSKWMRRSYLQASAQVADRIIVGREEPSGAKPSRFNWTRLGCKATNLALKP